MCVCVYVRGVCVRVWCVCVCVHFNKEPIHDFHVTVSTVCRWKKSQPLGFNFLESVKKFMARARTIVRREQHYVHVPQRPEIIRFARPSKRMHLLPVGKTDTPKRRVHLSVTGVCGGSAPGQS